MADYMNLTAMNIFDDNTTTTTQDLNPIMNQASTIGIVNLGDLAGLISEDWRSDFAAVVHIPKIEFSTPISQTNNVPFWTPITTNSTCTLLGNHRIPEDLRTAGGIGFVRDASRYQLSFTWMSYNFRKSGPNTNFSVINNQRLKTFLGFSLALGTIGSTTSVHFLTSTLREISYTQTENHGIGHLYPKIHRQVKLPQFLLSRI